MTLATYFKIIEIREVSTILDNYRICFLIINIFSHDVYIISNKILKFTSKKVERIKINSLVRQGEYSWDSLKLLLTAQQVPTGSLLLPTGESLFHRLSSGSYFCWDTENQMYLGAHACKHIKQERLTSSTSRHASRSRIVNGRSIAIRRNDQPVHSLSTFCSNIQQARTSVPIEIPRKYTCIDLYATNSKFFFQSSRSIIVFELIYRFPCILILHSIT